MVRRLLTRITAPVRGLHQAAYLLAGLTLAAQVLALLRDRLFASRFGAGETLDLYYAAFKLPDLVFTLVVSLVSAYVLIPRIAGLADSEGKERARALISRSATFLCIAAGLIALVAGILAPQLLALLFPAFTGSASFDDFVLLVRLLLAQPLLLGLSSVLGSVTQLKRRFFIFALSPVLYNLGIIIGVAFFYDAYGLPGIGLGVLLGAAAHLAVNVPTAFRAGLLPRPMLPATDPMLGIVRDSVPRSLALGMGSLTTLILLAFAARGGEGSVAVLTFGMNLSFVPLSLIGAAYATAAFPVLAEQANRQDAFRTTLTVAARHIIFWSSVVTVLAIVLRAHIVRILLGAGAFDWDDTRLTAAVLAILIVGLLAQGLVLLASRAFYAAGRSWNPFFVQASGLVLSVTGAVAFFALAQAYPLFRYALEAALRVPDVPGTGILFVAFGAMFGQLAMGALALVTLRMVAPGVAGSLARPLFDGVGAGILGGAAAYGALAAMGTIAPLTTLALVFAQGAIAGIVGLIVAGTVLALLENQEFRGLVASLRKLRGANALMPYGPANDRPNP